jgi:hypothetical protein
MKHVRTWVVFTLENGDNHDKEMHPTSHALPPQNNNNNNNNTNNNNNGTCEFL